MGRHTSGTSNRTENVMPALYIRTIVVTNMSPSIEQENFSQLET